MKRIRIVSSRSHESGKGDADESQLPKDPFSALFNG
jgi:hypothetical protein